MCIELLTGWTGYYVRGIGFPPGGFDWFLEVEHSRLRVHEAEQEMTKIERNDLKMTKMTKKGCLGSCVQNQQHEKMVDEIVMGRFAKRKKTCQMGWQNGTEIENENKELQNGKTEELYSSQILYREHGHGQA